MSKERELIDELNGLRYDLKKNINLDNYSELARKTHETLFKLSDYQRDNVNKIENQSLLDLSLIKGINQNYYVYKDEDLKKHLEIYPPTYHVLDNNRIMIISDLHYFSKSSKSYKYEEDSIQYVDKALEFARDNNIKEIAILGDLVDGYYYVGSDNKDKLSINSLLNSKTYDDYLNEVNFITTHIRKLLPNVKVRVLLGNHDINAINRCINISNKGEDNIFDEYISSYTNNNISVEGLGNSLYAFGKNIILFNHEVNKYFGLYNPFEVEYGIYENDKWIQWQNAYAPFNHFRTISGHAHAYYYRTDYYNRSDISNVHCPCLMNDKRNYYQKNDSYYIDSPGFLILDSIDNKILVEPYFILKYKDGSYKIDSFDNLHEKYKTGKIIGGSSKFLNSSRERRLVLEKIIY